jgi:hypothetical protein
MELPPGVPDPIFLHELALELKMSVAELTCGRGTPMSAHELTVAWPAFFRARNRETLRAERERELKAAKRRGR